VKVYVLDVPDANEYSRIEGIYSTRELAEAAAPEPVWAPEFNTWERGEYAITAYELDKVPTRTRGA
jgi:hypothetical protein